MLQQRLCRHRHFWRHRDVCLLPREGCYRRYHRLLLCLLLVVEVVSRRQALAGGEAVQCLADHLSQLVSHVAPQCLLGVMQPTQLRHAVHQGCSKRWEWGAGEGGTLSALPSTQPAH